MGSNEMIGYVTSDVIQRYRLVKLKLGLLLVTLEWVTSTEYPVRQLADKVEWRFTNQSEM